MAPIHRVAVIQFYIKPLEIEENHTHACDLIRKAASQGATLAVLPEYHLNGWAPEDPRYAIQAGDYRRYLTSYQSLARELNICLVPGTIVERHSDSNDEATPPKLFNVAYFIDNKGDILGSYRKKNLWIPEREHLHSSTSDRHEVFDTPFGKVGLLICWDLAFPEAFRELIAQGAKMVIMPTFWTSSDLSPQGLALNPTSESLFLTSTLTTRSFENTCCILFSNAGGPSPPHNYIGLSQVTMPILGPVGKLEGSEEGVLVVDVDMEVLDVAEGSYKVREDIGREGWHYSYRHDSWVEKGG